MEWSRRKFDVTVFGGINTDFVIRGRGLPKPGQSVVGESFYSGPGGKGANQAVAAALLGARVAMIGSIGNESRGRAMVKNLRAHKIDVRHVRLDSRHPTGAALISVNEEGEKQITAALGANLGIKSRDIRAAEELIAQSRVLLMQFEAPMETVLAAARLARKHRTLVLLDPAPPANPPDELFPLLDLIRPNSDEAEHLTGIQIKSRSDARAAARRLLSRGVRIAALESGDGGDLILTQEEEHFFPRLKVKTVDATGAGDAFAGAFAAGMAEVLPLREIGRLANATAALSITKLGAQEALPARAQVERFLRRQAGR